jgi:DNA-binding NarL/FixJ family response regulator
MIPTRVFVVASSPLVRAGLRSMLADGAGTNIEVVGDAPPGDSGAEITLSSAEVVLVSDDSLPEETYSVAPGGPQALVLLSEDESAALRLSSLSLSGWGVVSPDAPPEELAAAIAAAANRLVILPHALTERLLEGNSAFDGLEDAPEPLTARESEILELLSRGLANKSIARELSISDHTVKFHVSSIYSKLQVGSRAEAVSRGARLGLLRL